MKLNLIKLSVKAIDKESESLAYYRQKISQNKWDQKKKGYWLVHKLHNYSKTKASVQN